MNGLDRGKGGKKENKFTPKNVRQQNTYTILSLILSCKLRYLASILNIYFSMNQSQHKNPNRNLYLQFLNKISSILNKCPNTLHEAFSRSTSTPINKFV